MLRSFIDTWEDQQVRLYSRECHPVCQGLPDHTEHFVDGECIGLTYDKRFKCIGIALNCVAEYLYIVVKVRLNDVVRIEPLNLDPQPTEPLT